MSTCKCGCGAATFVPRSSDFRKGWKAGVPVDFAKGHNMKTKPEYLVEDRGFKTPCWIWNRAVRRDGYGQARLGKRCMNAHRMVWIRSRGAIEEDAHLDHLCTSRLCVNPDHLQEVSPVLNNQRAAKRTQKLCCELCGRPF